MFAKPQNVPTCKLFDVIAGTFSQEESAKKQVRTLKELGYCKAKYQKSANGLYAVIALSNVDRLHADAAKHTLEKEHNIQSYITQKKPSSKTTKENLMATSGKN